MLQIKIISEGSCDIEDYAAENSALPSQIAFLKYITKLTKFNFV